MTHWYLQLFKTKVIFMICIPVDNICKDESVVCVDIRKCISDFLGDCIMILDVVSQHRVKEGTWIQLRCWITMLCRKLTNKKINVFESE